MKKFKKIVAGLMAVAAMATSMVGINASAYDDTFNVYRIQSNPSYQNVYSKEWPSYWHLKTAYQETKFAVTSLSFDSSACSLYACFSTGIDTTFTTTGDTSVDTSVGVDFYGSVTLQNYNSGTNTASGWIKA